ncbi:uncharacterized protein LOC143916645 isoform X2 [Arctopsyche grandis]|uniref:uncharacterized protein LOC143916645 isoform X2 n=1 Tax=Arctopsyche grandis TaxID=121162 RepID=UPI00406D9B79
MKMECRLCLQFESAESSISIYTSESLLERIQNCCQLQIQKYHELSENVCQTCMSNLKILSSFKNVCRRNDKFSRVRMAKSLNIKPEEEMLYELNWENDPEMRKCVYKSTSDGNSHIQLEASTTKKGISHNSFSESNESTQNGISRSCSRENLLMKIQKVIFEDFVEKSLFLNENNPKNLEVNTTKQGISHNSNFEIQRESICKFSTGNESTQNNMISNESFVIKPDEVMLDDIDWENKPQCVGTSTSPDKNSTNTLKLRTTKQGISHNSNPDILEKDVCAIPESNESTQNKMISNESFVYKPDEVMLDDIDWENEPQCVGTSTSDENSTNKSKLSTTKQGISHNSNPEILEKDVCALPESNESTQNNMISNESFVIKPEEVMLDDIDWANEPQCVGTSTSPDENSTNISKLSTTKQGISHNSNSMMHKENVYVLSASNESTPNNEISKIENDVIKPNEVNLEKPTGIEKSLCTYENNPKNSEVISTNQIVSHVFNQEEDEDSDFFHELSNSDEFSEYSDSAEPTHIKENLPIRGKLGLVPANRVLGKITMPNESVQNNIKNSFSTEVERDGTSEIAILYQSAMPNELVQNNIEENSNTELQRVNTSQIAMLNESTLNNIKDSSSTQVERDNTSEIAILYQITMPNELVQNNIGESSNIETRNNIRNSSQTRGQFTNEFKYSTTKRGKRKLIYLGSKYNHSRISTKKVSTWKCGTLGCQSHMKTKDDVIICYPTAHCHESCPQDIEASIAKRKMAQAKSAVGTNACNVMKFEIPISMPNELVQNNTEENSNTELQRVNTSQIAMLNESTQNNIEESSSTQVERANTSEIAILYQITMPNELVQNNIEEGSSAEVDRVNTSEIAMLNESVQDNIKNSSSTEVEIYDTSEIAILHSIAMLNELVQNNIEGSSSTQVERINSSEIAILTESAQNKIEESSSTEIERVNSSEIAVQNNIKESSSTEVKRVNSSEIAILIESAQNNIGASSSTQIEKLKTSEIAMLIESGQNNIEESVSTKLERDMAMFNESIRNNIDKSSPTGDQVGLVPFDKINV